ncbi:phosphoheptose isomerase [Candidatus Blochmanniella floridana]|uniref:Phosphoheptose isomerase n=1 Tax=Blochmanniella floridana TaxID=203907 RepID=Q7VQB4_BLOFL|nr:phosphoheptose isomerase [Candidatus Blochmannia floridanus]
MYSNIIYNEFDKIIKIMQTFIKTENYVNKIQSAAKLISNAFKAEGKVLSCGNGGSHCNAMHFAEELTGRYRANRPGYPAIVISDPSYLSCVSNDFGYENIFARFIESVGKSTDILFAISSSGKSKNILKAITSAYNIGMKVIFLTGDGSCKQISNYVNVEICIPYAEYLDYVQEIHIKIIHTIILIVEKEMLI